MRLQAQLDIKKQILFSWMMWSAWYTQMQCYVESCIGWLIAVRIHFPCKLFTDWIYVGYAEEDVPFLFCFMNLKISPLRTVQILSRNRNSRNISFRNVIRLLIVYLLGVADDPSIKSWRLDYKVRMEAQTFAREWLSLNTK